MREGLASAGGVGCLGGGGAGALLPCHLKGGQVREQGEGVLILAMLMGMVSLDADRYLGDGLQDIVVRTGLAVSFVRQPFTSMYYEPKRRY